MFFIYFCVLSLCGDCMKNKLEQQFFFMNSATSHQLNLTMSSGSKSAAQHELMLNNIWWLTLYFICDLCSFNDQAVGQKKSLDFYRWFLTLYLYIRMKCLQMQQCCSFFLCFSRSNRGERILATESWVQSLIRWWVIYLNNASRLLILKRWKKLKYSRNW